MHAKQFFGGVVMSTLLTAVAYADHDFVRPLNIQLFCTGGQRACGLCPFFQRDRLG
jgi:hypothetical protein